MKDFDTTKPHGSATGVHIADALHEALRNSANRSGGWPYYAGKSSRLEPTCWALFAFGADGLPSAERQRHRDFLTRAQQANGWLADEARVPVNISFNALVAVLWLSQPDLATDAMRSRLLSALVASKGVQAPPIEGTTQDNSLQGWPWIDATFSWVEPTAWALVALKMMRRLGSIDPAGLTRIDVGDRLMINRCCKDGGWNFGNASMMHQDLRPYVPTTALGLIAMQDRRGEPAVAKSLAYLEQHWPDEISAIALGLSLIALSAYGRSVQAIESRLDAEAQRAVAFGNLHAIATVLTARKSAARKTFMA